MSALRLWISSSRSVNASSSARGPKRKGLVGAGFLAAMGRYYAIHNNVNQHKAPYAARHYQFGHAFSEMATRRRYPPLPVISTNQFKNGTHIEVAGTVFKILEFQH